LKKNNGGRITTITPLKYLENKEKDIPLTAA